MLAKLAQIGPESGARHLCKPAGMLAKLGQIGPQSGARHLWKPAGMLAKLAQAGPESVPGTNGTLFHSMRASWQTELRREFPLHVVCSWLGNSPRIAQQSYLLVTEDDFAKAAGVAKVMMEGWMIDRAGVWK